MQFKMGSAIPDELILRRYKDEDGEIFLEIIGMDNVYIRTTQDNRYYYKIDKSAMQDEELTLVDDYSSDPPTITPGGELPLSEQPTAVNPVITREILDKHKKKKGDPNEDTNLDGSETFDIMLHPEDQVDEDKIQFSEGQKLPKPLRDQCTPNDYGGFTLRYNKFLYMLSSSYRVEIKTPDTNYSHVLEAEPAAAKTPSETEMEAPDTPFLLEENVEPGEKELQSGDYLPYHFRDDCEDDIGPTGGKRLTIGNFLYFLGDDFKVIQKMKISSMEDDFSQSPQPAPRQLTTREVTANLVNTFSFALERYSISADYFRETVLGKSNRDNLIVAFNGDLTHLNDDTREAAAQGKNTHLQENGFTFLKAAIIHELYINSTLSGRGDKMKYFLTHISSAEPDGTLASAEEDVSSKQMEKLLEFFKERAEIYDEKADIIFRIHRQIRKTIGEEFRGINSNGEKIRFDAFLITRLYENTTRLDRGDGITMIRLVYSIIKYWRRLQSY